VREKTQHRAARQAASPTCPPRPRARRHGRRSGGWHDRAPLSVSPHRVPDHTAPSATRPRSPPTRA